MGPSTRSPGVSVCIPLEGDAPEGFEVLASARRMFCASKEAPIAHGEDGPRRARSLSLARLLLLSLRLGLLGL